MRNRSNKIRLPIHFVWATKDRLPLIPAQEEERLWRYLDAVCRDMRCDPLTIGGMPDHIHLLVNFGNTVSLAEFMKRIKGGSSRFISQELRGSELFQWQAHYGAFSVEPGNIKTVAAYISNQKQHHSEGTIYADWEEVYEKCEEDTSST